MNKPSLATQVRLTAASAYRGLQTARRKHIPTAKQFQSWTIPSKASFLGLLIGLAGVLLSIVFFAWTILPNDRAFSHSENRLIEAVVQLEKNLTRIRSCSAESFPSYELGPQPLVMLPNAEDMRLVKGATVTANRMVHFEQVMIPLYSLVSQSAKATASPPHGIHELLDRFEEIDRNVRDRAGIDRSTIMYADEHGITSVTKKFDFYREQYADAYLNSINMARP